MVFVCQSSITGMMPCSCLRIHFAFYGIPGPHGSQLITSQQYLVQFSFFYFLNIPITNADFFSICKLGRTLIDLCQNFCYLIIMNLKGMVHNQSGYARLDDETANSNDDDMDVNKSMYKSLELYQQEALIVSQPNMTHFHYYAILNSHRGSLRNFLKGV